jgi:hypothetical protein
MSGELKALLADFGLARFLGASSSAESLTQTGESLGTLGFMSPEQVEAKGDFGPMTEASDVWGLGATLFFSLTGHAPFEGSTPLEVMAAITMRPPPALQDLGLTAPRSLEELLAETLKKDPRSRPSMTALAQRLEKEREAVLGIGSSAKNPGSPQRKALALALALLLAILIVVPAWLVPPAPRLILPIELPLWSRRSTERLRGRLNRGGLTLQIAGTMIQADREGRFEGELPLIPGENKLRLQCEGEVLGEWQIQCDREPPELEIFGQSLRDSSKEWRADSDGYLSGRLEDAAPVTLRVLGKDVPVNGKGEFRCPVPNSGQPRSLELEAEDAAGNSQRWDLLVWSARAQELHDSGLALSRGLDRFSRRFAGVDVQALRDLESWSASSREAKNSTIEAISKKLPEFKSLGLEEFSCGAEKNELLVFRHEKTGLRFILIPGSLVEEAYYADPLAGMERAFLELVESNVDFLIMRSLLGLLTRPGYDGDILESIKNDRNLGAGLTSLGTGFEDRMLIADYVLSSPQASKGEANGQRMMDFQDWRKRRLEKLSAVEKRQVWRYVEPFLIADCEITIRDWRRSMGRPENYDEALRMLAGNQFIAYPRDETPVFANLALARQWLSEAGLRLPDHSEWRIASRGGSKTRYYFGESHKNDNRWINGTDVTAGGAMIPRLREESLGENNAFGLYNVLGNVGEWVEPPWKTWQEAFPDGTKASAFYGEEMLKWGATCGGALYPIARVFEHELLFIILDPAIPRIDLAPWGLRPAFSIP